MVDTDPVVWSGPLSSLCVSSPRPCAPQIVGVGESGGGAVGDETQTRVRSIVTSLAYFLPEPLSKSGFAFIFHALISPIELLSITKSGRLHIFCAIRGFLRSPPVGQALPRRERRRRRAPGGNPFVVNSSIPSFSFDRRSVPNSSVRFRACVCSCWQLSILQWPRMKL